MASSSGMNVIVFLVILFILLSIFNQDDDFAHTLGQFASDVMAGFNGKD